MHLAPKNHAYFSHDYFAYEQKLIFAKYPQYVGHELMCQNHNDYICLDHLDNSKLIYNKDQVHYLIDNICKHRSAIMKKGRGNCNALVCDLHKWSYNEHGALVGAPGFNQIPICTNLKSDVLTNYHGLLFNQNVHKVYNIPNADRYINFNNYQYSNSVSVEYGFNWKTFIEVYSEDYHVDPFHPGLGHFVDCNSLDWIFGDSFHIQSVAFKQNPINPNISKLYSNWHKKVKEVYANQSIEFGAIWITLYPNLMIECYPKTIVISLAIPVNSSKCRVITQFYYPDDILGFDDEYVELQQQVYFETAKEDDEICYRMHEGRLLLYNQGIDESPNVYQNPTEKGLEHFHHFLQHAIS